MKQTNPMLLIDFYKAVHAEMLPKGITKSVSYFTPRMSRVKRWNEVAMFGLQGFIKEYLVDYFNEYFFFEYRNKAIGTYKTVMDATLGKGTYGLQKIEDLYDLGYLPIEIKALPEGTLVPMHVPMFSIENTHKDFAWLPQALESLISAEMWHPMIAATVGHTYRQIVNKFYEMTCDDNAVKARALGAFDFRGEECLQSAVKAGAGWCLSFLNTATVPTIPYLERNYNCDCTKEPVAFGSPSTEHSVMCSNYAIDGDEETLIKRLLTDIYPNTSFSAVLDSYDYWNVVENILPKLKNEIMNHNGCFLVRGDSGDCVDVVTRTVFKLWEEFGGTTNSKGYKVLDPHVKSIYGDSITVQRCEQIYDILEKNGFAASNVALGVGSFSFQCIEEDGVLKPFTRDTFSSCIKATYCEIDGKPYPIFKNPKDGGFKKSQRGLCHVYKGSDGKLTFKDGYTSENLPMNNLLETVFRDGKLVKEQSLQEIRRVLNEGEF
jgi:nicotinamide phosphoribosyltransferase